MSIEFLLPAVGENIEKADIGGIKVSVGDVLTADQVVMEIETDKAVFELPCPHAGKVVKIHVKTGQAVAVGTPLLTIEQTTGAASAPPAAPVASPAASVPAAASAPAPSRAAITEPEPPAQKAPSGPASATATAGTAATDRPSSEKTVPAPAGPATRRLARELGVDLYRVPGTGTGGRITQEDVQAFVREQLSTRADAPAAAGAATGGAFVIPPLPDFSQFGPVERQSLNKVMRVGAANLSLAWNVVPHVTQHELADVTELEAARKRYSQSAGGKDGTPKVTMTVLAMKAIVIALKAFPRFNASYDAQTGEVVLKQYYNIGVAVDTENGLMVPVIRAVDSKSIVHLAAELTDLAQKARDRKLTAADMQGGTFTITNLGGIGGTYFTPIVNYPEVAILGMSRTSQQQVVLQGAPQIRLLLPLSLSYDHRVINGADAARFIVKLAGLLSDPFHLMSEV
ncbi:MAG: 2-oxo acid dehydrogenase subunit E2 [Planctomycetes bacterium]|nr:2-oxo acid dehydrogenase subunit E2 [Planctomycetota bacterium]